MRYLPGVGVLVTALSVTAAPARQSAPAVSEAVVRVGPENFAGRVEDRIQSGSSAPLDRLIEQYRHGNALAAVEEFANWDAKRVDETIRAATKPRLPGTDIRPIAALVMLCTRAAVQRNAFAMNGRALPSSTPTYYEAAYRMVKTLRDGVRGESASGLPPADSMAIRAFCRNWFVLATAMWMSAWQCGRAADVADSGLASLGDDAQVLLAAGSVAETRGVRERTALAGACESPWSMTSLHGPFMTSKRTLESAEGFLQRALALDESLAEARLHLGRVFYWDDRPADAVRELERAIADAPAGDRDFIGYLAAIFLGQVHEEAHRTPEALRAYQRATELNPRGQVAHLALGRFFIASGHIEDGWAQARAVFGKEESKTNAERDPWAIYRDAQLWRATRLGREMDAWVQQ